MKRLLIGLMAFLGLTAGAHAADLSDLGPAIGTKIPHDLSSVDHMGTPQNFDSVKGENGAILIFFRSAKWCPYCQKQLISVEDLTQEVQAKGYNLVGISYDDPKVLAKFKKRRKISYPLLSDGESEIIDAFGIRNEKHKDGHYAYGVPHPLVAIVDANGVIRAKLFEQSYKNRPQTEAILQAMSSVDTALSR